MHKRDDSLSISLPKGVKDLLPETAGKMRSIEEAIFRIFKLWGYGEVRTPLIEYLDVLGRGEQNLLQRMFKFEDRVSGRVLSLRPDITAQIARLVSSHLKDHPKPVRLCYKGSVLHHGEGDSMLRREVYQSGLELIGLSQPEADGEIIAITIEALRSAGLNDFKIDVGQVEFFRGVIEDLGLAADDRRKVEDVVARKDRSALEELLPGLGLKDSALEVLLSLPTLFGGRAVLDKADSISLNDRSKAALENLSDVLDVLESYDLMDMISIDLGEIRGFDYYTGVIFEGFVAGTGEPLCGGGRYDTLLGRYGYDCAATGFAIDIEVLLKALGGQGASFKAESPDILLVNRKESLADVLKVASHLRAEGFKVARSIIKRDFDGHLAYAEAESINKVAFVGGDDLKENEVLFFELNSKEREVLTIEDLLDGKRGLSRG